MIAGIALALPLPVERWLLPLLAAVFGFLLGLAIGLAAPAGSDVAFSIGGALGGLWIAVTPVLLCPPLTKAWARVLVRIFGSWLIAIGVMLGGARVIPQKPSVEPLPPPAPTQLPRGGDDEFGQP